VKVVLDGQGADEFLIGYDYFWGIYFKELWSNFRWGKLLKEFCIHLLRTKRSFGIQYFIYYSLPASIKSFLAHRSQRHLSSNFLKNLSQKSQIVKEFYNVSNIRESSILHAKFKLEHLLKWEDRNSMWHSIEARVPFLDHRLVELSIKLQTDQKIEKGVTKVILRKVMRGHVHNTIIDRITKNGFDTPSSEWFKSDKWQRFIRGLIQSDSFQKRSWWNANECSLMYDEYLKGNNKKSNEIWKFIHLELWMRKYNVSE
jgi:asparagine synthase (glutamine-hydrolysing)